MRLERELDPCHRYVVGYGLPMKDEALRRLNRLDHATAGTARSTRAVPRKCDRASWTQIDGRGRAEPGAELVRLNQRRPHARRRNWQNDFAFDRVRDLHGDLPASACN